MLSSARLELVLLLMFCLSLGECATLTGYEIRAQGPLGIIGDHTYVQSADPGDKWGCFGRDQGGKGICSGSGDYGTANCISQPGAHSGIIYGVTGVCHQCANRILYPAGVVVSQARGYGASVALYGTYGRDAAAWAARIAQCSPHTFGPSAEEFKFETRDLESGTSSTTRSANPERQRELNYLHKVQQLYEPKINDSMFFLESAEPTRKDVLQQELKLYTAYRLNSDSTSTLEEDLSEPQAALLARKADLEKQLNERKISPRTYAFEVNKAGQRFLISASDKLGVDQYEKVFGLKPGQIFQFVKPETVGQAK